MPMNPNARAPRPRVVELNARYYGDPDVADSMSPLDMLSAGRATRAALDVYDWECVEAARKAGATWQEIGQALGMPRQNAQRKFGDPSRRPSWQGTSKPLNQGGRTNR